MTSDEPHAPTRSDILARATLAASPRIAGSLSILYEGFRDRHRARAEEVESVGIEKLT